MAVYFRKSDKRWFIRVNYGGRRHTCYSPLNSHEPFKTKKEAADYEPIFCASLMGSNVPKDIVITYEFIQDFYLYMKERLKPSTYYGYKDTFDCYWADEFLDLEISKITNPMLEGINRRVFSTRQNWQGKSAAGKLFIKFLRKTRPDLDPDIICQPKVHTPKTRSYQVYTEDEFRKFFSVIEDKKERFLFLMLYKYGLRISEALGLRWSDFKPDGLHIERCACVKNDEHTTIFTSPKTKNSYRVYPILECFKPYIKELRPKEYKDVQVFETRKRTQGSVWGQTTVRRLSMKYAALAGVKCIKLHEFRHSCVSNLLMHKQPVRLVARWVGDTESMVLNTYSHLLPNEKSVIADFMNSLDDGTDDNE